VATTGSRGDGTRHCAGYFDPLALPQDHAMPTATSGQPLGLICRACGGRRFKVLYTRARQEEIKRCRQCHGCGQRTMTCERQIG
jgi:hypothetical protein